MTPRELEDFRSALAEQTGLRFDDDKLPQLAEVLGSRLRDTNSTARRYLDRLRSVAGEAGELARSLSVSETYFFRNRDQFRALEAIVRERQASSAPRRLRILSAGCSTGEEPYSLAIAVRETLRDPSEWDLRIAGVDLNPESIARANAATYSSWSLRATPDSIRRKYFRAQDQGHALAAAVRDMVELEQQNLVQAVAFWKREAFEIVFCRNLLMYLTPEAAAAVVADIARALVPGGYLFVGHAENLRGLSQDFDLVRSHETFYYRRKGRLISRSTPAPPQPVTEPVDGDVPWAQTIARAASRIERLSKDSARGAEPAPARRDLTPVMDLVKAERFHQALELLGSDAAAPDALLLRAALLVSTGQLAAAASECARLLDIDGPVPWNRDNCAASGGTLECWQGATRQAGWAPSNESQRRQRASGAARVCRNLCFRGLHAGAHYVLAICSEHGGDAAGAVEHSRTAAYLDAGFAMPHLQLGRLARRAGDLVTARRELGLALALLAREAAERVVLFGGGFSRDALVQLCRGELRACESEP